MNHLVNLNSEAKEIENLLKETKTMVIHGADVECFPHGIVKEGDTLYFTEDSEPDQVKAKGIVSSVFNSPKLTMELSYETIIRNQEKLVLPDDLFYKWAGRKYLVLVELRDVRAIQPFSIDRDKRTGTGDWYSGLEIKEPVIRKHLTV